MPKGDARKAREHRVKRHTQERWNEYFNERLTDREYKTLCSRAQDTQKSEVLHVGKVKKRVRTRFKGRTVDVVLDRRYKLINTILPPPGVVPEERNNMGIISFVKGGTYQDKKGLSAAELDMMQECDWCKRIGRPIGHAHGPFLVFKCEGCHHEWLGVQRED